MKIKMSVGDRIFTLTNHLLLALAVLVVVYPLYIILIASVSDPYAVMRGEVPASVREHYLALERGADACIGCKACESRCPFGVKIAERMEKTAALFGPEK